MPKLDSKQLEGVPAWVDLMTDDPEAARAFYASLFGWTYDVGGADMGGYSQCLIDGRKVAGLSGKPPGMPMPNAWNVYFAADSVDAVCERITAAGGAITVPAMDVPGAGRMAIAQEPTGAIFGLWQGAEHKGFQLVDEPGSFSWTDLNTRDLPRAQKFLEDVFGYSARRLPGLETMNHVSLLVGEATASGIMQMDQNWPPQIPPHWMICFAVANADETIAKVRELGGTVHIEPFATPFGRLAVVTDAQQAAFSILQS